MDKLVFDKNYWFPINEELWKKYELSKVVSGLGLSVIIDCLPKNTHYALLPKATRTIMLVKNQPKGMYLGIEGADSMSLIQYCLRPDREENSINHPNYYNSHPSGTECIEIAKHYPFCIGNVIKYLWRAGLKKDNSLSDTGKELEDLMKAKWYLEYAIDELKDKMKKDE